MESGLGLQIHFVSQPDIELAFESLANDNKKIELLSVRKDGDRTIANVFVPDGKLDHFEKYISRLLGGEKKSNGDATTTRRSSIRLRRFVLRSFVPFGPTIRRATLRKTRRSSSGGRSGFLCAVNASLVVADFRKLAALADCVVSDHQVNFPERTIVLMFGSRQQLSKSVMSSNCVAELRRAKDTAEFFDGMERDEQQEWLHDMLARLTVEADHESTPRVCLLDSGVNRGHPLLAPLLDTLDLHTVKPAWGTDDRRTTGLD